ncbi:hypothetical protein ACFQPG_06200 [Sphingomonas sp. GCM10030256]|uniref:hypothetical protein n=1 Tax=Sphingomonas sp. GCM10030256 TaxID=3273427 RepID=UPI003618E565
MRFLALPCLAAAALSACASPSERIADALVAYGIDRAGAACVGGRLERNLSIGQLQELARLARSYRESDPDPSRLTPSDLLRVAAQVQDPRVPVEVARAATGCGLVTPANLGPLGAFLGG